MTREVSAASIESLARKIADRDGVGMDVARKRAERWAAKTNKRTAAMAAEKPPSNVCICPSPRCQHPDCDRRIRSDRARNARIYGGSSGNW